MRNIMKQTLAYSAGAIAFASATWSFIEGNTWPGILAVVAGILAVSSVLGEGEQ